MSLIDTIKDVRKNKGTQNFPPLSSFLPTAQPIDLSNTIKEVRQARTTPPQLETTNPFIEAQDVTYRAIQSAAIDIPKTFLTAIRTMTEPRKPSPIIMTFPRTDKFAGIDVSFLNKIEDKFKESIIQPLNEVSLDAINLLNKKQQEIARPLFDEKPGLSNWKEYLYTIESGGISLIEAVGISLLTKNTSIAAGFLSSIESTDVYNKARSEGIDHPTALLSSVESGVGTFLLEKIGLDFLFSLGGANRLASALKSGIFETGQEELQTIWQNLIRKKNIDKTQKIFEGWYETAVGIAIPSFLTGLFLPGVSLKTRQEVVGDMAKESGVSTQQAENAFGEMLGITRRSLEQFEQQAKKFVPGLTIEEVEPEKMGETIRKIIAERKNKLEEPVVKAVNATFDEGTSSSGFHEKFSKEFNGIEPSWAIVYKGEVSEELKTAAEEAGLKINIREAPKGTGNFITDVYLPNIKQSEASKATEIFDNFAELYNQKIKTTETRIKNEFDRAEAEVLMALEISHKGERIFLDTGEVKGVASTFPKFVPEELRSKELFDQVIRLNTQGKQPKGTRQAKLMDIISQEIIKRMDINLADEKVANDFIVQIDKRIEKEENQFLKELEKNISTAIKEKIFTVKQVVQKMETAEKKGFKKGVKLSAKSVRNSLLNKFDNEIQVIKREKELGKLKEGIIKRHINNIRQSAVDYAKSFLPKEVRGELISQLNKIKNVKDFENLRFRIQEIGEKSDIRNLKKEITKQLSDVKPRKQAGKPRGKFTPFHQKVLDGIKEAVKLSSEQAEVIINGNLKNPIVSPETALQNKILDTFSGLDEVSSTELQKILDTIIAIKEEGRLSNELQKFNLSEELDRKKNMVIDYATNLKGIQRGIETTGTIKKTTGQNLKIWLKTIGQRWIVSWNGLMKIITFNSPIEKQQAFLDVFNLLDNENKYKELQQEYINNFNNAVSKAYNIKNKPNLIRKKIIDGNKLVNLGIFKNSEGVELELKFTKAELMKMWAEFQDTSLDESFAENNHLTQEIKEAIVKNLTEQDIAFAKEALNMWKDQYKVMNPVFSKVNGVDLPQNDNYSPIRRIGFKIDSEKGLGEFIEEATYRRAISPSATKTRVKNSLPIEKQNIFEALDRHFTETNYYVAWAEKVRELDTIFKDPNVRFALEDNYGKKFNLTLSQAISDISTKGNKHAGRYAVLDVFRKNFTLGALMLKPVIAIKQYVSTLAYAEVLTPQDFVLGIADFWKDPIKNTKILNKESIMIRERGSNIERDIKAAMQSDVWGRYSKKQSFNNIAMLNVKIGDKGAVLTGSWAIRRARLAKGVAIEEVIKEYETFTSETQQSSDLSELSQVQRGGSFEQLFTMFLSSPRQYLAKEVNAVRSLFQEGGHSPKNIKKVAKAIVVYHILLPVLFQWVSNFGGWDEEDRKDYLRASILGGLNGLFIFGEMVDKVIRTAMGMRVWSSEVPIVSISEDISRAVRKIEWDNISTEDVVSALQELVKAGNSLGVPIEQSVNMSKSIKQLMDNNIREGVGLMLGWTPYSLKIKEKKSAFPSLPKIPKIPELPKLPKLP